MDKANFSKDLKRAVSTEDARKKRNEVSVNIRKNKREEGLRKRRFAMMKPEPAAPIQGENGSTVEEMQPTVENLPNLNNAMNGSDRATALAATRAIRKLLSTPQDPPVQQVVDIGALPKLVQFLQDHSNPALQFEAAWALTNIGSSDLTFTIVEAGILPHLVVLLKSPAADVREQAVWCLGNIAGDKSEFRDMVLTSPGALEGLLLNMQNPSGVAMQRNVAWTLSNLCRGKPPTDLSLIQPVLPLFSHTLKSCEDIETLIDVAWACSYVSDGTNERIQALIELDLCTTLVQLCKKYRNENVKVISPVLRTLGNIVTGSDDQTQAAVNAGLLREIVPLAEHSKQTIRKEACWTASNITAGTKEQIGAFLAMPKLIETILKCASNDEWPVKKEAAWVISNVCTGGAPEHIQCLVEREKAIPVIFDLIKTGDIKINSMLLTALNHILATDPNEYTILVDECGGLDVLEDLQEVEDEDIYNSAVGIIEKYFGSEEDDENVAPNVAETGDSFAFKPTVNNNNNTFSFN
eukprot:CAMPEP_0204842746 /NCGR_PEP_ID=MMETSP1346-20131115/47571_1 /ASSEMBLY_ACC=CAM_ASM_000771 /TAXON_ID=215587 /ORGANISM="Aplanochytrium stocchinoi, Strain GSBS06" /LENGTH=522 /DNA_ID=CAMNT_0051981767 /DNA_START=52 /DNA_END=1617 /DNA_ORIENTATION=-